MRVQSWNKIDNTTGLNFVFKNQNYDDLRQIQIQSMINEIYQKIMWQHCNEHRRMQITLD